MHSSLERAKALLTPKNWREVTTAVDVHEEPTETGVYTFPKASNNVNATKSELDTLEQRVQARLEQCRVRELEAPEVAALKNAGLI